MLTMYRRHTKKCSAKFTERQAKSGVTDPQRVAELHAAYVRCVCPVWLRGNDSRGVWHRETLNTNDWDRAEDLKREIDRGKVQTNAITIADALDGWIKSMK